MTEAIAVPDAQALVRYRSFAGCIRESVSVATQEVSTIGGETHAVLTIARYSAAISSGLCEVTRRDRGGIVGRWTKPAVASPVCDVLSEASLALSDSTWGIVSSLKRCSQLGLKLEGRKLKR